MEREDRHKKTYADCPCRRNCEFHGDCEACREHHSQPGAKYLPVCERRKKVRSKKTEAPD